MTDGAMAHAEPPSTPVWRCVLLSGPAGSGKTTVCRLGHHAMVAAWGHVVEGHVNRIKRLKRQMFGRAGFPLLRKRVLLA
jgi:ABC-type branched-subunit amino acid transport system ATPase component